MSTVVERVMGMAVSIDVRDEDSSPRAVPALIEWLHHVDRTFSPYLLDSEISRFGLGEIGISELSREVEQVLLTCIELTDRTRGAFDAFAVPAPNGSMLDPCGYVKGWAIETGAAILEGAGMESFAINAGGDIVLRGQPRAGERWRVGIRHPDDAASLATTLLLEGPLAVATSATYERGAHIIDPRSGLPTTVVAGATVVGPDLAIADAFATACFVMGLEALDWIESEPEYSVYVMTHDGIGCWSSRFPHPSVC